jgi:hypothetical protein
MHELPLNNRERHGHGTSALLDSGVPRSTPVAAIEGRSPCED